jgi:light-regulated signal transduction histidine kinase (bacteriophytochrome)
LRLEQELRSRQRELQEKNTELEQFAYIASHDLQAPLRKIQTFSDRLTARHRDSLDNQAQEYLTRIHRAAARMQRLIDDLLTLARVTSRVKPFAAVDLNSLVQDVISDLEPQIEKASGTVQAEPLPVVHGDETQLRQLFQNLIGNALKFHRPEVAPVVRIYPGAGGAHQPAPECRNDYHDILVEDNGIGFDNQDAGKIFQIFQRLPEQGEYEGTGIGLAVCKKIVERHGGRIWASSERNKGSKFLLALPASGNNLRV